MLLLTPTCHYFGDSLTSHTTTFGGEIDTLAGAFGDVAGSITDKGGTIDNTTGTHVLRDRMGFHLIEKEQKK